MNLLEKLMNIQNELQAPKNQFNGFGKYNYRNCEDILEAVKPHLLKYKCTLNLTDEIIEKEGRFYVKSTVTIKDAESTEVESSIGYAREEETKKGMDGSQVTGASSSYARKYALSGLFAIDDNKDSDSTNTHGKGSKDGKKTIEAQGNKGNLEQPSSNICCSCSKEVNENITKFSNQKFKKTLCLDCQKKVK